MARRKNQYKKQKKRRLFQRIFKVLAILTLLIALTVGGTAFFKVEYISIEGNNRYADEDVVMASSILQGENLFQIHCGAVENRIAEKLPYVETVEVRRVLPNAIGITLTEWNAVACVETVTDDWLISVGGKLLEAGTSGESYMTIQGLNPLMPKVGTHLAVSDDEEENLNSLLELLLVLEAQGIMDKVSLIDVSKKTSMSLRFDGRFDVLLPLNADYDYKLRALQAAVADRDHFETGEMDLTQPDYGVVFSPYTVS